MPMAGHKGYGIAVLIEVISAVLTGALFTLDVACWLRDFSKPVNEGHAFIAIDIKQMMPVERFKARMDKMIEQIHEAPKANCWFNCVRLRIFLCTRSVNLRASLWA